MAVVEPEKPMEPSERGVVDQESVGPPKPELARPATYESSDNAALESKDHAEF